MCDLILFTHIVFFPVFPVTSIASGSITISIKLSFNFRSEFHQVFFHWRCNFCFKSEMLFAIQIFTKHNIVFKKIFQFAFLIEIQS
ncbi:hypothetical protein EUTSA_v10026693mg [Eutrema salsugineum]|uniref:Uncharacterized protein n=1 Tax=Eutrema salsugineum TaxID=72664 RepID=V4MSL6_EUTSA|nr:hypothetical protein EUTSA_v10026693mg [Eutrema salsugineum]